MAMVGIRVVWMAVRHGLVLVVMGMALAGCHGRVVPVVVVHVTAAMHVLMAVLHRFMPVRVLVPLGQV